MSNQIPGIYNYCDRWCEQCSFTSRCLSYEHEENDTDEEKYLNNQAFSEKIAKNLADAVQMIYAMAKERGIDLENIPAEEEDRMNQQNEEIRKVTKQDPLILLCNEYIETARSILRDQEFWKRKADEMLLQDQLGTSTLTQLKEESALLKDCWRIVQWYLFFISVKFQRAISGRMHGYEDPNEVQTDFNGSAKIALVAVSRSQQAWAQLFKLIPDEDRLLPPLSLLVRIEKMGREKFPRAMEFIRPGFDEVFATK